MRNLIQVTSRQTAERAKLLVDAEYKSIQPAKLSRTEIVGQITSRLLAGQETGAVLDVLDRNDMRDENIAVAERIFEGWKKLA
jgi:hypothetical protein